MIPLLLLSGLFSLTPVTSQGSLTVANGYSAAVIDAATGAMTGLLPHPYAERSPGVQTPDLAYDLYGGLSVDGGPGMWLGLEEAEYVGYVPGTGLVQVVHRKSDVKVESFFFAPWDLHAPSLAMVLRATNEGDETRTVILAALSNLHLGMISGQPHESAESLERVDATHYEEFGQGGLWAASYRVSPTPTTWSGTETNPFERFQDVGDLPFTEPFTGSGDDRVLGVARGPLPLDPEEGAGMALVIGLEPTSPLGISLADVTPAVDTWFGGRSPDELIEDEIAGWIARLSPDTHTPSSGAETAVWRQGLALTLMAQVREPAVGAAHPTGQILASLPPGMWNRTWPRDMSYAISALARTGFADQAFDAISFVLAGTAGGYVEQVGADYLVSITRYFGDGSEESDGDPNIEGPNIEFDGFGLFLWSLGIWAEGQEDLEALQEHWSVIREKVADVLVGLVEPETGLIAADSSIWEVHWNGRQKHFTYTNAAAVAGLCAASRIAERLGDQDLAQEYRQTAQEIRDAVLVHLVDPIHGYLGGNLEELATGDALDGAVVEAINWGLIDPDSELAATTMASLNDLRISIGRGYSRNDDGGWYDRQEWVFVTLRVATALRRMGREPEADALVDWVVQQSRANYDMIAELYTEEEAAYAGAVPMAGYGAGALALARLDAKPGMDATGCITWEAMSRSPEPSIADPGQEVSSVTDAVFDVTSNEAYDSDVPTSVSAPRRSSGCGSGGAGWPVGTLFVGILILLSSLRRARTVTPSGCTLESQNVSNSLTSHPRLTTFRASSPGHASGILEESYVSGHVRRRHSRARHARGGHCKGSRDLE